MEATLVRISMIGFELYVFNEEWVCSVPGVNSQRMRREALEKARDYLLEQGAQNNPDSCLEILGNQAVEIQNCRKTRVHEQRYLELKLRMFAITHWLLDNCTRKIRGNIEEIARNKRCPEITAILQGEPIT